MSLSSDMHECLIAAAESVEKPNAEQRNRVCCSELFETAEAAIRNFVDSEMIFGAGWEGELVQEQQWTSEECIAVQIHLTEALTAIVYVQDGFIGPQVAAPIVSRALRGIAWLIDPEVV